jgi:hypothetical protein
MKMQMDEFYLPNPGAERVWRNRDDTFPPRDTTRAPENGQQSSLKTRRLELLHSFMYIP